MVAGQSQARPPLGIRREGDIQIGLGVLAFIAAATGTWWLLQGRLHPSVWLGVAGALTLALTFLSEGSRARDECASHPGSRTPTTVMKLIALRTPHRVELATHRRRLLGGMVFGIMGSVGGPGLSVLLRILSRGGTSIMDLLAWLLFTLPIALAVWMLPPRGLGRRSGAGPG
jgi:hypothetical protein